MLARSLRLAAVSSGVRVATLSAGKGLKPLKATVETVDGSLHVVMSGDHKTLKLLHNIGFTYDSRRHVWLQRRDALVARLPPDTELSSAAILEAAQAAPPLAPSQAASGESVSVHVENSMVHAVNSFKIRNQLKALGFQYDALSKAWVLPIVDFETKISRDVSTESLMAHLASLTPAGASGGASGDQPGSTSKTEASFGAKPVSLQVQNGVVFVYNSFSIKDRLRNLGFRFDGLAKAWLLPEEEFVATIAPEVTIENLMEKVSEQVKPRVVADGDRVLVYNSFDIKDTLKRHGFRFSSAEKAWTHSMSWYLHTVGESVDYESLKHFLENEGEPAE